MLSNLDLTNVMILAASSEPMAPSFELLDTKWQDLWKKKSDFLQNGRSPAQNWEWANRFPEFSVIRSISVGHFNKWGKTFQFKIKNLSGAEDQMLKELNDQIVRFIQSPAQTIVAHHGRNELFPLIAKRMMHHKYTVPDILEISAKRPWEINLIDTAELWSFGNYKSDADLDLIHAFLGFGSTVGIKNITPTSDAAITTAKLLLRFKGEFELQDEFVSIG